MQLYTVLQEIGKGITERGDRIYKGLGGQIPQGFSAKRNWDKTSNKMDEGE